jgi:hypothetical protein
MANSEITFEHKLILQNALNIWVGSILQQPELFTKALAFEGLDELIMCGVLYCGEEKVRDDFGTNLLLLARNHQASEDSALGFLLRLLSKNFFKISEYSCRQFFDLFNELIDLYY